MMRLRPRTVALCLAVLAIAGLSALGGGDAGAAAPAAQQAASTLNWQNCQPSGYQCATLTVPLDYSDASKGTIKLALTRLPATNPSDRIGSLLSDPGGPGDSAIDFLHDWAPTLASTIRDHFDLVAFDPRGVGQSTPIVCHNTLQAFTAVNPLPTDQAGWLAADAAAKKFADDCSAKYGDYLNYVGTKNVARDMESVRVALGEDKLTYLGYSYGTTIGAVYADMFPGKVRAFVLDGATDLSQSFEEINGTQMVGFERGFSAYVADCKTNHCFGSQDPQKVIEGLIAQSEQKPFPAPEEDRPSGPGEVLLGVLFAQYSQSLWPQLTQAATLALRGDGSGFVEMSDEYLQRNQDGSYPNISEANAAVNFVDET
ncbi:MAG: alpha/beta fold hydrolase, partial [Tepidiformaceae bacterium]